MWGIPYYGNSADTYADGGLTPSTDSKPSAVGFSKAVEAIAHDGQVD